MRFAGRVLPKRGDPCTFIYIIYISIPNSHRTHTKIFSDQIYPVHLSSHITCHVFLTGHVCRIEREKRCLTQKKNLKKIKIPYTVNTTTITAVAVAVVCRFLYSFFFSSFSIIIPPQANPPPGPVEPALRFSFFGVPGRGGGALELLLYIKPSPKGPPPPAPNTTTLSP